jgi:hypothetical protein
MGETEQIEDSRLVQDFATPGSRRVYLKQVPHAPIVPQHHDGDTSAASAAVGDEEAYSKSRNTVGDAQLTESGVNLVGDYISETVVANGGIKVSGAINEVRTAKVGGNAILQVGNTIGGTDHLSLVLQQRR